jgi:beta-lactamase regulating signal transducer with metallopeptidase domain
MTALLVKSTLAMLAALLLLGASRRSRASLRHLILAALFAFLLFLPLVQHFAPAVPIAVASTSVARFVESPQPAQPLAPTPSTVRTEPASNVARDVIRALPTVYAGGAAALLLWLAVGVVRLRVIGRDAETWLEGTAKMNAIANASGIRRPALVALSDAVDVPLTYGFRQSTIILPVAARHWADGELTRALRHELEHVRRDDWALQLLARVACALYWPHPIVWVAWRRFCLEAERACDDAVVESSEATAYAGQLVSLARSASGLSAMPALGMASPTKLRQRIEAILDPSVRRGPHSGYAAAGAAVALLALLVSVAPARFIVAATAEAFEPIAHAGDAEPRRSVLGEALVKAAEAGDVGDVQRLLDAGVPIDTVASGDGTALIGAARGGHMHMIEFLLGEGANPNVAARGDGSPLIAAARHGYEEIVMRLLDAGADIDRVVQGDENALMQAAWNGHARVVRLLLDRGADVNIRAYDDGRVRTALGLAIRAGHHDVAEMLVAAGARE